MTSEGPDLLRRQQEAVYYCLLYTFLRVYIFTCLLFHTFAAASASRNFSVARKYFK